MIRKIIYSIIIIVITYMGMNLFINKSYGATDTEEQKQEGTTIDNVMKDAQRFLNKNSKTKTIDQDSLKSTSNFIYTVLLGIAMVVAVIVGIVMGMQFMTASVEEKAKVKESLIAYVVGCIVVFGAFGIWKLLVNVISKW